MRFINPDEVIEKEGLSVYFYYWHGRTRLDIMRDKRINDEPIDSALWRIWIYAMSYIRDDFFIKRLQKGEKFKFDLGNRIYQNLIHYCDREIENKKICISLCDDCKNAVNIHLSRYVKYCPNCSLRRKGNKQQIRRALEQGRRFCKNRKCQKPLPKKYPNKEYCTDNCGKIARREREKIEKSKRQMEATLEKRNDVIG